MYLFLRSTVSLWLMFFCISSVAQTKTPFMFRWLDKHAKKHVRKYIQQDTLIKTSEAILHINYSNDTTKSYLLLLHGMGANARTNWNSQIKALSKEFNLILPDLIYFGESTSNSQNYSVEFQVQQINEAILKLGIKKTINVMGFSYGGLAAAIYNELYQPQVNKLIIIDGPVKFYSGQLADSLAMNVGIKGIVNVVAPTTLAAFKSMQKAVMSSSYPATKRLKRRIIKYIFIPTKTIRDKQMNYLLENQKKYQKYNYNLDKTPTLLIWGEKDGIVPVSVGKALHKAYPNTQLIIFPKAKHDTHFRESKALNKAVINFIKN